MPSITVGKRIIFLIQNNFLIFIDLTDYIYAGSLIKING